MVDGYEGGAVDRDPDRDCDDWTLTEIPDILKFVLDPVSEDAALSLLSTPNEAGNTPLHYAALNGQLLAVQYLVGKGADPYLQNRAGHDAIYEAEINDKREAVEWMLREGGLDEEVEEGEVRGDGGEKVLVDEEALKVQVEDLVLGEKEEGKGKGRAE